MSCDHCTMPDGTSAYPYYGSAPHMSFHPHHGGRVRVESEYLPRDEWPSNFAPDPEYGPDSPLGTYTHCPVCGVDIETPETSK